MDDNQEIPVWDYLIELQNMFIEVFNRDAMEEDEPGMHKFNQPENGWINKVWSSPFYRRAHVDVVDARESKGLWMMHVCIFPHFDSDAPIFGFDVIAGKNKMTGAFHDFSPTVNAEHEMIKWFAEEARALNWKRERELPEWAKQIFSGDMIAAGNVRETHEINQLMFTVKKTLDYYLMQTQRHYGKADVNLCIDAQNNYAHWQKQNPHTPRVMKSLGLDETDVEMFIEECLFPEIPNVR